MRIVSQDAVHTAYKPYRNESFWNSTVTVLSLLSDHLHLHTGTAGNWHSHLIREQVPGPGPCISPMLLDPAVKRQPVVTDLSSQVLHKPYDFSVLEDFLWGLFFHMDFRCLKKQEVIFLFHFTRDLTKASLLNQITSYAVRKLCSALLSTLQSVVENSQGVWNIQDRGRRESNWHSDIVIAFLWKARTYNRWTKNEISKNSK